MHDIDRTSDDEFDFEFDNEYGSDDEFDMEFDDEFDDEFDSDSDNEGGVLPGHVEEELAMELLSVEDDQEMEQFLGSIAKFALPAAKFLGRKAKQFYNSRTGRSLRKRLANKIRTSLPDLGRRAGGYLGTKVANWGASKLGYEAEMDDEMEMETAKKLVRFAADATKIAAKGAQRGNGSMAIKKAIHLASKKHGISAGSSGSGRSGKWVRRGRKIILFGV